VKRLYDLKRQVLELLVITDALVDPITRVMRTCPPLAESEIHEQMVQTTEMIDRVLTRTQTLSDLITTAIEANLTQVSLQQNEDMRKISAWVAIAAVPTLIAGIYGMNFQEMPELRSDIGYPAVLLAMGTVCFLLYRAFRRSDWL
jgi:magnesium transporter